MKVALRRFRPLAILLVAIVLGFFMLRWFEQSQVYFPSRVMAATGKELGRPMEDITFKASDGVALNGWFFPADATSASAHRAILFCHGNAGNISHRLELCSVFLEAGVNVFVFDYRGYGRSQGKPSEEGTYLDAQAAHEWLQQRGFANTNLIVFGESLGGGVACELVTRKPSAALILQSTFTSIPDIGAELFPWLPVRWLARIKYDTCSKLPKLKIPVLVMHSRVDDLIHYRHAEKNFAVANEPKSLCEIKGGHNDPLLDRQVFLEGIRKFIESTSP